MSVATTLSRATTVSSSRDSSTQVLAAVHVFLCSGGDSALEVLTLRQHVVVLKRKRPRLRPNRLDRFFWTTLHRLLFRWAELLVAFPQSGNGRARRRPSGSRTQMVVWGTARARRFRMNASVASWHSLGATYSGQGFGSKSLLESLYEERTAKWRKTAM